MWLFYSLLAGAFYTVSGLSTRYLLKNNKDAWSFSFWFSAIGALVSLPLFLRFFSVATNIKSWIVLLLVGLLIVLQNFLNFTSSRFLEASINSVVTKVRLVWILIIGVVFLGESFTAYKITGTVLTVLAGMFTSGLLMARLKESVDFKKGVFLAFSSTFFYATVIGLYKFLFSEFSSQSLTFFIFLIPALINFIAMPNRFERMFKLARYNVKPLLLACGLGGFANLAMNHALSLGEASKVLIVIESFLVLTLVGENIVLKEKKHILIKFIGVILAIFGAILVQI